MSKNAFWVLTLVMLLFITGCSGYARLRLQSGRNETMTVENLKENWEKYHVLATGVELNVPSAILFDRKDDHREVLGERWWELRDSKSVSETISWIDAQDPVGSYTPRLWAILGPDGHLYGYMFTAWNHAVMPIGDDHTLRVMDLPVPPFLAVSGPDVRDSAK